MKIKLLVALGAIISIQPCLADSISKEIEAVEKGLRSTTRFVNDPVWTIERRMEHYGVPGVSIAVIKDYKVYWVKHYGVTDKETNKAVNDNTLFQAGSISKPVAAYGALKLVEQKKLSLDSPVNEQLVGWKIPDNEYTKKRPIALKHLLNHSAGLTVHGFGGYAVGSPVPTVTQVLDGKKPANSAAVRANILPETEFRYSGGGYTVMQKLVSDVTKTDYPEIMDKLVLAPLAMTRSTYEQPLPPEKLKFAAAGYLPNKQPVPGKRHTYPEMAAAGLWTTAEDLARFAIDVQLSIKGDKGRILSQSMTNKMLTPFVSKDTGLGFFIQSKNNSTYFGHGGWDEGFSADLMAHKNDGYGVVIMTNSNHPAFIEELRNSVAAYYQWDNFLDPELVALPISKAEQQRIVGRYRFSPDMIFTIFAENDRVFMQYLNDDTMEVFRIGDNQYVRREFARKFRFEKSQGKGSVDLIFGINNERTHVRARMKKGEIVPFELVMAGQLQKAEKRYATFFAKYPDEKGSVEWNLLKRADKLVSENKDDTAIALLRMSSRLFSNSPNSFRKLAQYYQEKGDKKNAILNFKKALAIQPENQQLAQALKSLGS
ncbi:serine hydrolase domain-containing protein [Aliikangiella coralliicola]|uniref:Serine hydrolase n=1 Tax=Aliikangiella coralliicola TaxID=2592383 RepID=A0A545UJ72_9GAMM|nr:serine hydrolase domain-containing protein [Aliikangiella coralliicola]TQV89516.1 serine hydrolase [Aliikangiella coralliicola]